MNENYTNEKHTNEDCINKKYIFEISIAQKTLLQRINNNTKWKV